VLFRAHSSKALLPLVPAHITWRNNIRRPLRKVFGVVEIPRAVEPQRHQRRPV
jgi:hypothetical protein